MKTKTIFVSALVLFVALLACASYKPTPAPVPMLDTVVYAGETYTNVFRIADPNGPLGLTITVEPLGLIVGEPNILPVEGYPEARVYVYPFSFHATSTGIKSFMITSTDSLGVVVTQQIIFDVKGNDPQVFIGVGEPNEVISGIWWNNIQKDMRNNARGNLVFHYNGVVEGKWGLSPKYESIDELKGLIAKYDNSSYVVMQGHLVE